MPNFKNIAIAFPLLVLCGCAASPREMDYASLPSAILWQKHSSTNSSLELLFLEAELGRRSELVNGQDFVGRKTMLLVGRSIYARTPVASVTANDHDCSDFPSPSDAQMFFLQNGGPLSDPHDLDRDGDGAACEWGTTLKNTFNKFRSSNNRPRTSTTSRDYYYSRCYTGPRGGRYTITASGNKNYNGC